MYCPHDRHIFTDNLFFQIHCELEELVCRCGISVCVPRNNYHKRLTLPGPRQTKRREKSKPAALKNAALIKEAGAENTYPIFYPLPIRVFSPKILQHRMARPFDILIGVVLVKCDAMERLNVLDVWGITTQHPGVNGQYCVKGFNLQCQF